MSTHNCFLGKIRKILCVYPLLSEAMLPEEIWPRGCQTFFMLNSAQPEIFSANKYENAKFSYLLAGKFSCSAWFSKKELAIVSSLKFLSIKNFMLS